MGSVRCRQPSPIILHWMIGVMGVLRDWLQGLCNQRVWVRRRRAAAAVGTGDDFEQVSVRILEVDPTPIIPAVDLLALAAVRIGPVGKSPLPNPREDRVEFEFAYQEGVMLRCDLSVSASIIFDIHKVQGSLTDAYDRKRAKQHRRWKAQQLGEECGR